MQALSAVCSLQIIIEITRCAWFLLGRGRNKRYPVANKKMVGLIILYSNYPIGIIRFGVLILSHMG